MKRVLKNITGEMLIKLHLKKMSKHKRFLKSLKKLMKSKTFWTKVIVLVSTLALIATSILPYVL